MKSSLALIGLIASLSAFALSDADESKCLAKYKASSDANVTAAANYMWDCAADFDYESADEMTTYLRQAKNLKAWDKDGYLDPLNIDACVAIRESLAAFCTDDLWTLEKVKTHLLAVALPEFYSKNPKDALNAYWVK